MMFRRLGLMLWKNVWIRKRKPYFQLIMEITMIFVLPVCLVGLNLYLPDEFLKDKITGPQRIETRKMQVQNKIFTVGYIPFSPGLDEFIQQLAKKDKSIAFIGYQSEKQLLEVHESNTSRFQLALTFRLRLRSDSAFHVRDIQEINIRPKVYNQAKSLWYNILYADGCRKTSFPEPDGAVYTLYTFLKSVFNLTSHNISLRTEDISCANPLYTTQFKLLIPALIIAAFLPGSWVLTLDLLEEKKHKLKESMALYGVSGFVYSFSWYIVACVQFILIAGIITWMLFSLGKLSVLPNLHPALIFALVLSYGLTSLSLSFCLRDFTTDAPTAAIVILVWSIVQIGFVMFRVSQESSFDQLEYIFTVSLNYWILVLGCHLIIEWEKTVASVDVASVDVASVDVASVDVASVDVASVDVASVDVASVDVASVDPVASVDVASVDVASVDVASVDVASVDVASVDVASVYVTSVDVASVYVASVDVASVDVFSVDVFSVDVASVDVASVDVASVDVFSVVLPVLMLPVLIVDVASVDVASVYVASVDVAGVDVFSVDVASVYVASVDVASIDVFSVDVFSVDVASVDVASVDVASVDVFSVDVASVDVASVDVDSVDVASVDVASVDVASVDVASVDVASVDVAGVDVASVDVASVDVASVDVASVDVYGVDVFSVEVLCVVIGFKVVYLLTQRVFKELS
ncbi:hypothetical protein Btru_062122 [Bulinus truncatus]|nr:hypothetical protein Btru_062122 [Bulinus truncatus]